MSQVELVQVARMLGLGHVPGEAEARAAIAARPQQFADALFAEAADSDDVINQEAALEYLDGRLLAFGDLVDAATAAGVRAAFARRLAAWAG